MTVHVSATQGAKTDKESLFCSARCISAQRSAAWRTRSTFIVIVIGATVKTEEYRRLALLRAETRVTLVTQQRRVRRMRCNATRARERKCAGRRLRFARCRAQRDAQCDADLLGSSISALPSSSNNGRFDHRIAIDAMSLYLICASARKNRDRRTARY